VFSVLYLGQVSCHTFRQSKKWEKISCFKINFKKLLSLQLINFTGYYIVKSGVDMNMLATTKCLL